MLRPMRTAAAVLSDFFTVNLARNQGLNAQVRPQMPQGAEGCTAATIGKYLCNRAPPPSDTPAGEIPVWAWLDGTFHQEERDEIHQKYSWRRRRAGV
jgi:hypothetical protein